ncbi:MAG TPA: DUF3106 domain-containing protein [Verrucomicrobiae bacterium]|jgi:hypothetical protein|nr:DUF3106 domain-containing protein [Verrucomicrobiae bacterium]
MRLAPIQHATLILLALALATMGGPPPPSDSGPPVPPHWYQHVTNGVTLHHLTPVAYFRGLLGMTPAERERVLADKSEEKRQQVLAKVREYEALPPEVREARLIQTELHWRLLVLLPLDPAERQARLQEISPMYQPMIMSQLARWDDLPADVRKALLEKESFLRTYIQWQGHSAAAQQDILSKMPAEQRARWTEELNKWQVLPENRREEFTQAFRQFFYSTEEQQRQTIQTLSETERRQMEKALHSYADLPPVLQRQCVDSFGKFAAMSAEERNHFLQNAAKWESMTAQERQLWRTLVNELPPMPPAPPGFYESKLPPMPPGWPGPPPASTLRGGDPGATNFAKAPNAAK